MGRNRRYTGPSGKVNRFAGKNGPEAENGGFRVIRCMDCGSTNVALTVIIPGDAEHWYYCMSCNEEFTACPPDGTEGHELKEAGDTPKPQGERL
jgi:DNA-directed RNA polymerase subunit RPC12/RpoP